MAHFATSRRFVDWGASLRILPRQQGVVLGGITVIAVGVGLAAMVFGLSDAYLWRPLPYPEPDRLVSIEFPRQPPAPGESGAAEPFPTLESWRERTDLLSDISAFEDRGWLRLRLSDRILPVRAVAVSRSFFDMLGIGRQPGELDGTEIWISERLVQVADTEFQTGRSISVLPDGAVRVAGSFRSRFVLPEAGRTVPPDAFVILPDGPVKTKLGAATSWPHIIGRLPPNVSPTAVSAALTATMPGGAPVQVVPLHRALTGHLRGLGTGAMLASLLVVVVCWLSVFSIALTRGLYRLPDITTRIALGASPRRLVRLFAVEGSQVAALGSAGAVVLAASALSVAVLFLPPQFSTVGVPEVTPRVAVAIFAAGAASGALWTMASVLAWRFGAAGRGRLVAGRDGRVVRWLRFWIVAGQLATATVFVAAATLLGRSYLNLIAVDMGMDRATDTVTVLHDPGLPEPLWYDTVQRVVGALRQQSGVRAAGASLLGLLDGRSAQQAVHLDHRMDSYQASGDFAESARARGIAIVDSTAVTGDYFKAIGLSVIQGSQPDGQEPDAVVANQAFARQLFGARRPVGEAVSLVGGRTVTIAGVVRDVRARGVAVQPRPTIYQLGATAWRRGVVTYVVALGDVGSPRRDWFRSIQQIDRMAVMLESGSVDERAGRSIQDRVFATLIIGLFAAAITVVTALGLAGIVAYTVVRRTRDIAIRLALGLPRHSVVTLVARDTLMAGSCGIGVGLLISVWTAQVLESLLFGVRPAEPAVLAMAASGLLATAIAAALFPAMRASAIAPASVLKGD